MLAEMDYPEEPDPNGYPGESERTVLSDFFIASPEQYENYRFPTHPMHCFPTVFGKGVDLTRLLQLECIIGEGPPLGHPMLWHPKFIQGRLEMIPCVASASPALTDWLAEANVNLLLGCASAWAALGVWPDGTTGSSVFALLKGVARLARQAKATGCGLYLWLCWA
jgi:hypothetical protein